MGTYDTCPRSQPKDILACILDDRPGSDSSCSNPRPRQFCSRPSAVRGAERTRPPSDRTPARGWEMGLDTKKWDLVEMAGCPGGGKEGRKGGWGWDGLYGLDMLGYDYWSCG